MPVPPGPASLDENKPDCPRPMPDRRNLFHGLGSLGRLRADRSAEDRRLRKAEAVGSNPTRSTFSRPSRGERRTFHRRRRKAPPSVHMQGTRKTYAPRRCRRKRHSRRTPHRSWDMSPVSWSQSGISPRTRDREGSRSLCVAPVSMTASSCRRPRSADPAARRPPTNAGPVGPTPPHPANRPPAKTP
jgi:hypothetical protein